MTFTITIEGPPRTKKNSEVLDLRGRKPRKLPSKPFQEWNASAQLQLAKYRSEHSYSLPICFAVNCCATIWREKDAGDAVGYYQAIADALQEARIIQNDRLIVSWDGSRVLVSRDRPHVYIVLTAASE